MKRERVTDCGGRTRAFGTTIRRYIVSVTVSALIIGSGVVTPPLDLRAQEETTRKTKKEVPPQFPPLARQLRLFGTARVAVVISPEGKVKSAHSIGGPPVFVPSAEEAAKHWEFEPATKETTQVLEFKFERHEN